MKLLINAGNGGDELGSGFLSDLVGLGYDGIRTGIYLDHQKAETVLRELRPKVNTELFPTFLLAGGHMTDVPDTEKSEGQALSPEHLIAHTRDTCVKLKAFGYFEAGELAIEIGNEPDLACNFWAGNAKLLGHTFARCFDVIREFSPTVPVLCPSVSNLNKRGFRYLKKMLPGIPLEAGLSFHRYPHDGDPFKAHPGFLTREEQALKLVGMAEGRSLWLTETGLTEGPHGRGSFHTEEYVADTYVYETAFWNQYGVRALAWYSINDGPDKMNDLHHYGIRRLDGTWKPVSDRIPYIKEHLA